MADNFMASANQDYSDFYKGQMAPPVQQNGGLVQSGWGQSQPSDVVRVTPEGLNVRAVNTVGINPDGSVSGWGGGMDSVDVSTPLQYGMLEDQFGLNDQSYVPGPNGYTVASKDQSRLGASPIGNLFAYGNEGIGTPATAAIASALSGTPLPRRDPRGYLSFTGPANVRTPFIADPWAGTRFGEPVAPIAGYGPAPSVAAALVPAPQHQNVTANDGLNATQRFLSDRGASTGGTIGQQANELNKLLGGRD